MVSGGLLQVGLGVAQAQARAAKERRARLIWYSSVTAILHGDIDRIWAVLQSTSPFDIRINSADAPAGVDLDPAKLEFGKTFAPDWFVADYRDGAWKNARVEALHNISLSPAAVVLHYAQSIFEGMKAYRWAGGKAATVPARG